MYDIIFIGHICRDEVTPFGGERYVQAGSALLCGAMVAPRVGARTAAVTRMDPADDALLDPLRGWLTATEAWGAETALRQAQQQRDARKAPPPTRAPDAEDDR